MLKKIEVIKYMNESIKVEFLLGHVYHIYSNL